MFEKPTLPEFIEVDALELGHASARSQIAKKVDEVFQKECKKAYDDGYEDGMFRGDNGLRKGSFVFFLVFLPISFTIWWLANFFYHRIQVGEQMLREEYAACARGDAGLCSRGIARNADDYSLVDSLKTTYFAQTGKNIDIPTGVSVKEDGQSYIVNLPDNRKITITKK